MASFEVTLYGQFWVTPEGDGLNPAQHSRKDIDDRIRKCYEADPIEPHSVFTIEDVHRLVISLNHISLIILSEFVSIDVSVAFYPVITRTWERLKPYVIYERDRRRLEAEGQKNTASPDEVKRWLWFALHFQVLAERMGSRDYRERISKYQGRLAKELRL